MSTEIRRLLAEGRLVRFRASQEMIVKEVQGAEYDVERARKSLNDGDYKWATIQAYYCMFHLARALLFSKGFREKSHRAILSAVRELFVRTGQLSSEAFDDLRNAMDLREDADYGMVFSEVSARDVTARAERFLETVRRMLQL